MSSISSQLVVFQTRNWGYVRRAALKKTHFGEG
jgi:hypothetical protein